MGQGEGQGGGARRRCREGRVLEMVQETAHSPSKLDYSSIKSHLPPGFPVANARRCSCLSLCKFGKSEKLNHMEFAFFQSRVEDESK